MKSPKGRKAMRPCMACELFGILPARPAVDPVGWSSDDVDKLCRIHRDRTLAGHCLLCGKAVVWASPFEDRSIGCCRGCLFKNQGLNAARRIEAEMLGRPEEEDDDPPEVFWN
jgi:hypothetical protein